MHSPISPDLRHFCRNAGKPGEGNSVSVSVSCVACYRMSRVDGGNFVSALFLGNVGMVER